MNKVKKSRATVCAQFLGRLGGKATAKKKRARKAVTGPGAKKKSATGQARKKTKAAGSQKKKARGKSRAKKAGQLFFW
jgi:hypothetical protein